MFKEKGTLPIGVDYEGELHREFEIRPGKMRDSIEARASEDAARLLENDEYMGAFLLGRRVVIGSIPSEAMTLDLMLDLWDDDINEIMAKDRRLETSIRSFRRDPETSKDAGAGAAEDGVLGRAGAGDAGAGSGQLGGSLERTKEAAEEKEEEVQGQASPEETP